MNERLQEDEVFDTARRLADPEQRRAYLAAVCAENPSLQDRIEKLLCAASEADTLFSQSASVVGEAMLGLPMAEKPGDRIGRYRLLEKLGEGGCGMVYIAEQEEPVRRQVALKIIKIGLHTQNLIARFEAERQALAIMDHPHIAKVFDAGATDSGRPYFVMELVRGRSITKYCQEEQLSTSQRVELFAQVCDAVQHAHQKGIIHRDLKPSNILVTVSEGVAIPKVIDFGIAQAIEEHSDNLRTPAVLETFLGTPAYISPEQAAVPEGDVDTRSDIYALGVLIYELLTGKTPFDFRADLSSSIEEIRRIVRERKPLCPSERLRQLTKGDLSEAARNRRCEPAKLVATLEKDLDWMVMKCLQKERDRRYQTARELAIEARRYLNDQPLLARPSSAGYRLQKTLRRNKLAFSAAGAVVAALLIGTIVSTSMFLREREARRYAVNAQNTERQLRLDVELRELNLIALQFLNQAKLSEAETTLRQVLEREVTLWGRAHPKVANSLISLSQVQFKAGQLQEAEASFREALAIKRRLPGANDPEVAALLSQGAEILEAQGKRAEAETLQREALGLEKRVHGNDHPNVASYLNRLAGMALRQKRFPDAELLLREAVAIRPRTATIDRASALTFFRLCEALREQEKLSEAAQIYAEALPTHLQVWPADPDQELKLLVEGLLRQKKHDELNSLWLALSPVMAGNLPYTLGLWRARADYHARTGRFAEAAADFERVVKLNPERSLARLCLAALLAETRQLERYREFCRKTVSDFQHTSDRHAAAQIAKACLLRADSGADLRLVSELADIAVSDSTSSEFEWFVLTKVLSEYRHARFDSALQWLKKVPRIVGRDQLSALAILAEVLLAMSEYQSGSPARAQAILEEPARVLARIFKEAEGGDLSRDWVDWIVPQVLLREAIALIHGTPK